MTAEQEIREWCDGADNLFVRRLRKALGPDQIARVLRAITETCNNCWTNDSDCQCEAAGRSAVHRPHIRLTVPGTWQADYFEPGPR